MAVAEIITKTVYTVNGHTFETKAAADAYVNSISTSEREELISKRDEASRLVNIYKDTSLPFQVYTMNTLKTAGDYVILKRLDSTYNSNKSYIRVPGIGRLPIDVITPRTRKIFRQYLYSQQKIQYIKTLSEYRKARAELNILNKSLKRLKNA